MNAFFSRIRLRIQSKMSTYDEMARNRGKILTENCCANVVNNLVGGNFLTGLLLLMDATTVEIGMISIIANICNTLQIFSPLLLERFRRRKPLLIASRAIIHLVNVVLIGLVAVLPVESQPKVLMILGLQAVLNIVSASTAQGFSIWHMKSIPENVRANYFSINQITSYASLYAFVLLGSFIVDKFKAAGNELNGMLILRAIAILFAVLDLICLSKIIEYPNEENTEKTDLKMIFTAPFKQKRYLISVLVMFLWQVLANTTGSFYTVYLLEEVNLSYSFLNIVGATYVPCVLFLGPLWARVVNRTSWFTAFYSSVFLYALFYVGQGFVTAQWSWLYLVVVVFCNIMAPGINISYANLAYYNLPRQNQTVYLTFASTVACIGALLGTYYATWFRGFADGWVINIFSIPFTTPQIMVSVTGLLLVVLAAIVYVLDRHDRKLKELEPTGEESASAV